MVNKSAWNCAVLCLSLTTAAPSIASVNAFSYHPFADFELVVLGFDRTPACHFAYDRVRGEGILRGAGGLAAESLSALHTLYGDGLLAQVSLDSIGGLTFRLSRETNINIIAVHTPFAVIISLAEGAKDSRRLPFELSRGRYLQLALKAEQDGNRELGRLYTERAAALREDTTSSGILYYPPDNPFAWKVGEILADLRAGKLVEAEQRWRELFPRDITKPQLQTEGQILDSSAGPPMGRSGWQLFDLSGERYKLFGGAVLILALAGLGLFLLAGRSGGREVLEEAEGISPAEAAVPPPSHRPPSPAADSARSVVKFTFAEEASPTEAESQTNASETASNLEAPAASRSLEEKILERANVGASVSDIADQFGISRDQVAMTINLNRRKDRDES